MTINDRGERNQRIFGKAVSSQSGSTGSAASTFLGTC